MPTRNSHYRSILLFITAFAIVLVLSSRPAWGEARTSTKLELFASKAKAPQMRRVSTRKKSPSTHRSSAARAMKSTRQVGRGVRHASTRAVRRASVASRAGLYKGPTPVLLRSSVAFVVDQDTDRVLLRKNASAVLPIASLTKLMTALVISEAQLPLTETLTITVDDVDRLKGSTSRLQVGTDLTREEALHLALMSSENRAAHALARTYPGGIASFVGAMNNKAKQLGMQHTRYVEPTGLSSENRSSARDLAILAAEAAKKPLLRKYSTSRGYEIDVEDGFLRYGNTNQLVRDPKWNIDLQKTGYIREAGQCLLMHVRMAGRKLVIVLLGSAGKQGRVRDAERVRLWIRSQPGLIRARAARP